MTAITAIVPVWTQKENLFPCLLCCQLTPIDLTKDVCKFSDKMANLATTCWSISDSIILNNLSKAPYCANCILVVRDISELTRRIANLQSKLNLKTTAILKLLRLQYNFNEDDQRRLFPIFSPSDLREQLVTELGCTVSSPKSEAPTSTEIITEPKSEDETEVFSPDVCTDSDPNWEPTSDDIEFEDADGGANNYSESETTRDESTADNLIIPAKITTRDCFVRLERLAPRKIPKKRKGSSTSKKEKKSNFPKIRSSGLPYEKKIECTYSYPESQATKSNGRCRRKFHTEAELMEHYEKVHINKEGEIQCPQCSRFFARSRELETHMLLHTGQRDFTCHLCGENFRSQYFYTKHQVKFHNEPYPHICQVCNEGFYSPSTLTYHSYVHTGNWPYRCNECDFGAATQSLLQRHKYNHVEKDAPPISCSVCNKIFKSQVGLKQHSKRHVEDRPHECLQCSANFKFPWELKMHKKNVHEAERIFLCQLCGADFKTNKHLQTHIQGHPTRKMVFAKRNRQKISHPRPLHQILQNRRPNYSMTSIPFLKRLFHLFLAYSR